jgi:acetylornithine/N-succinyldiaminopimelate aminotransferase
VTERAPISAVDPEVLELDRCFVMPTYKRFELEFVAGQGTELVARDGRRYLDFVTGLSVSNFGHCHPRVVEAVQDQVGRLIHCSNLYLTEPQARLAKRLSDLAGGGRVFFGNSGAEANEAALKIARKRCRELGGGAVITLERSFHGRTMATLSATGQRDKQQAFNPPLEVFIHVEPDDVEGLRRAFTSGRVAAFMAEPVLGESGVHPLSEDFLREAARLCEVGGALLIMDEVQTGLGRCGAPFAYQRYGLDPELVTVAKSLGGGLPIGACIARREAENVFGPGDHGSTFGGGPVVAAAALAVLDLLSEEGLLERVEERGARLEGWLRRLEQAGLVTAVRRLGLMAACELAPERAALDARRLVSRALEQGILLNATSDLTVRFLPPLIVTAQEIDRVGAFLLDALEGPAERRAP